MPPAPRSTRSEPSRREAPGAFRALWYDPEGAPPPEAVTIPRIEGAFSDEWSDRTWHSLRIDGSHCREIVDMAHFFYVHSTTRCRPVHHRLRGPCRRDVRGEHPAPGLRHGADRRRSESAPGRRLLRPLLHDRPHLAAPAATARRRRPSSSTATTRSPRTASC
ncbi:hypothetical protein [Streptomyces rubradiris]|uniref:hypothetical protein n=1 Tax=Streptomyces rubradiris TaxID=285531 RepID=UPI00357137AD